MSDGGRPSLWGEPAGPYLPEPAGRSVLAAAAVSENSAAGASAAGANRPRQGTVGVRVADLRESAWHRWWVKGRATVGLVIIALLLGLVLAAALGGLIWAVAAAVHHAASQ